MISFSFFARIVFEHVKNFRGDDREAEGNALLMRRMATPYRGFESLSLRTRQKASRILETAEFRLKGLEKSNQYRSIKPTE